MNFGPAPLFPDEAPWLCLTIPAEGQRLLVQCVICGRRGNYRFREKTQRRLRAVSQEVLGRFMLAHIHPDAQAPGVVPSWKHPLLCDRALPEGADWWEVARRWLEEVKHGKCA